MGKNEKIAAYIIPKQFVLKELRMPDRVTGIDDERFLVSRHGGKNRAIRFLNWRQVDNMFR
jgi:hypothetical protein